MGVRVKICGITLLDDALAAIHAGADALGLVFYAPSPRAITIDQAQHIISRLPPFVTTTALFVDAPAAQVKRVIQATGVDLLQFHGNESPAYCGQFSRPYIKAIRVTPDLDLLALRQHYHQARGLLLDAYKPGVPGGTGEQFDWQLIPPSLRREIILAGGLKVTNAATAIAQVNPYALDVSGGVEKTKGVKDHQKIQQFMNEVRRANNH